MLQTKTSPILSIILLLSLGITWSAGYAIAHYCTTHGVHPVGYAFWQSLGPAILLLLLCLVLKIPLPLQKNHLIFYLIAGLIGIALPNVNMYFAAAHLPAGILAVVVNTVPVVTFILALCFREEKFSLWRFVGVLLTFSGIILLTQPDVAITNLLIPWLFVALLSPICFSLCAVYASKFQPKASDPLSLAAGMMIAATLWLIPFTVATKHFYTLTLSTTNGQLILLEILLSSVGYWLFFQLLKRCGAVYYSLVGGVVAIIGLFWGWLVFGEVLSMQAMFAVTIILVGVLLVSLIAKPNR